ncbi:DUF481 domain-containing protein [Gilvimarinus sp. SDUM040013]|uniref:DUF481 domain-containing protein n=1 Tax=Gilvimarinus gilvus TaxID=3058038 RepID=A0ABU4RWW3_9GAMM|nr:DUF481 domain-containing protein [Gilvimarinus sp. SDUM040013]MDO3386968.1 DUF481 domain-containing protein [Gilvimarinus sp. SDUM040013]MDX6848138.1 DUF481 domain-containing protein [Gilvimarinus sp. SDUM040013]
MKGCVAGVAGVAVAALMGSSVFVIAEEAEAPPEWEVSAELGALNTTGNTETMSLNGKIDVTQNLEHWRNNFIASALYKEDVPDDDDSATDEREKTAEKYFVSAKSAYLLMGEHGNLFGYLSHTHDEFGSYRKYSTAAIGYGNRLIHTDSVTLDAEVGPGHYWGDKVVDEDNNIIVKEDGFMVRVAGDLKWVISENATFTQELSGEFGDENTRYQSDTAISTKINGSLQMKAGYTVSHDTEVADDKEKTDTTTYINLVYSF